MDLNQLYADFAAVLRAAPNGEVALSGLLLPVNSADVAVADILGTPCQESIDMKLANGAYLPNSGGPQLFFHDLKLVFGRLVGQWPQDSAEYVQIAQLFKFAIDLLVREANRLRFVKASPEEDDIYLQRISHGFDVISAEVQDWNSETFWVTAANGPMFMSAPKKAPVDPRDTVVAGSVHTVKLLPYSTRTPESTLGFTSPLNPRFPQPELPPTDLLSGFRHPNDSTIVPPLWITGKGGYASFAPTSDSNNAVVSSEEASAVWTAKAGSIAFPNDCVDDEKKTATKVDTESTNGEKPKGITDFPLTTELLSPEDLELLLRWTPYSFVDDDELEAAKNGTEKELVSSLLLQLQVMQNKRMSTPPTSASSASPGPAPGQAPTAPGQPGPSQQPPAISSPAAYPQHPPQAGSPANAAPLDGEHEAAVSEEIPEEERHIALKTANVLKRLVANADSSDISLEIDMRLPVLMRNYVGSLPAATDPALHQQGFVQQNSQRLQTLANMRNRRPLRR